MSEKIEKKKLEKVLWEYQKLHARLHAFEILQVKNKRLVNEANNDFILAWRAVQDNIKNWELHLPIHILESINLVIWEYINIMNGWDNKRTLIGHQSELTKNYIHWLLDDENDMHDESLWLNTDRIVLLGNMKPKNDLERREFIKNMETHFDSLLVPKVIEEYATKHDSQVFVDKMINSRDYIYPLFDSWSIIKNMMMIDKLSKKLPLRYIPNIQLTLDYLYWMQDKIKNNDFY